MTELSSMETFEVWTTNLPISEILRFRTFEIVHFPTSETCRETEDRLLFWEATATRARPRQLDSVR
jgi:hypothetical protein